MNDITSRPSDRPGSQGATSSLVALGGGDGGAEASRLFDAARRLGSPPPGGAPPGGGKGGSDRRAEAWVGDPRTGKQVLMFVAGASAGKHEGWTGVQVAPGKVHYYPPATTRAQVAATLANPASALANQTVYRVPGGPAAAAPAPRPPPAPPPASAAPRGPRPPPDLRFAERVGLADGRWVYLGQLRNSDQWQVLTPREDGGFNRYPAGDAAPSRAEVQARIRAGAYSSVYKGDRRVANAAGPPAPAPAPEQAFARDALATLGRPVGAPQVIQSFASKAYVREGDAFTLYQRELGNGQWEVRAASARPHARLEPDLLVGTYDRKVTDADFGRGRPLWSKVEAARARLNDKANLRETLEPGKPQRNALQQGWDALVSGGAELVTGLPKTVAGAVEGLARKVPAQAGNLGELGQVVVAKVAGVPLPKEGLSNPLNRERRQQFAEGEVAVGAVTQAQRAVTARLGADPDSLGAKVGAFLPALLPLVRKAPGRVGDLKVSDVVKGIRDTRTPIDEVKIAANKVANTGTEGVKRFEQTTPGVMKAMRDRLVDHLKANPNDREALRALKDIGGRPPKVANETVSPPNPGAPAPIVKVGGALRAPTPPKIEKPIAPPTTSAIQKPVSSAPVAPAAQSTPNALVEAPVIAKPPLKVEPSAPKLLNPQHPLPGNPRTLDEVVAGIADGRITREDLIKRRLSPTAADGLMADARALKAARPNVPVEVPATAGSAPLPTPATLSAIKNSTPPSRVQRYEAAGGGNGWDGGLRINPNPSGEVPLDAPTGGSAPRPHKQAANPTTGEGLPFAEKTPPKPLDIAPAPTAPGALTAPVVTQPTTPPPAPRSNPFDITSRRDYPAVLNSATPPAPGDPTPPRIIDPRTGQPFAAPATPPAQAPVAQPQPVGISAEPPGALAAPGGSTPNDAAAVTPLASVANGNPNDLTVIEPLPTPEQIQAALVRGTPVPPPPDGASKAQVLDFLRRAVRADLHPSTGRAYSLSEAHLETLFPNVNQGEQLAKLLSLHKSLIWEEKILPYYKDNPVHDVDAQGRPDPTKPLAVVNPFTNTLEVDSNWLFNTPQAEGKFPLGGTMDHPELNLQNFIAQTHSYDGNKPIEVPHMQIKLSKTIPYGVPGADGKVPLGTVDGRPDSRDYMLMRIAGGYVADWSGIVPELVQKTPANALNFSLQHKFIDEYSRHPGVNNPNNKDTIEKLTGRSNPLNLGKIEARTLSEKEVTDYNRMTLVANILTRMRLPSGEVVNQIMANMLIGSPADEGPMSRGIYAGRLTGSPFLPRATKDVAGREIYDIALVDTAKIPLPWVIDAKVMAGNNSWRKNTVGWDALEKRASDRRQVQSRNTAIAGVSASIALGGGLGNVASVYNANQSQRASLVSPINAYNKDAFADAAKRGLDTPAELLKLDRVVLDANGTSLVLPPPAAKGGSSFSDRVEALLLTHGSTVQIYGLKPDDLRRQAREADGRNPGAGDVGARFGQVFTPGAKPSGAAVPPPTPGAVPQPSPRTSQRQSGNPEPSPPESVALGEFSTPATRPTPRTTPDQAVERIGSQLSAPDVAALMDAFLSPESTAANNAAVARMRANGTTTASFIDPSGAGGANPLASPGAAGNEATLARISQAPPERVLAWFDTLTPEAKRSLPEPVQQAILESVLRPLANEAPSGARLSPGAAVEAMSGLAGRQRFENQVRVAAMQLAAGLEVGDGVQPGRLLVAGHDSGLGASVGEPTLARLVEEMTGVRPQILLIEDQGALNYGNKRPEQIESLSANNMAIGQKAGANVLVAMCNTLCSSLPAAAARLGIPYFDLVRNTISDVVARGGDHPAFFATEGMTNSGLYQREVQAATNGRVSFTGFGAGALPYAAASPEARAILDRRPELADVNPETGARSVPAWAAMVDGNWLNSADPGRADPDKVALVRASVRHFVDLLPANSTSLGLYCTHYPALITEIRAALDARGMANVPIFDNMQVQARELGRWLNTVAPRGFSGTPGNSGVFSSAPERMQEATREAALDMFSPTANRQAPFVLFRPGDPADPTVINNSFGVVPNEDLEELRRLLSPGTTPPASPPPDARP